jgi:hypothetical protein
MLTRRDFLVAAGALVMASESTTTTAEPILATTANTPQLQLTPSEQLMYSTVRLFNESTQSLKWGTGFVCWLFHTEQSNLPVIVTNRHVIDGWDKCTFSFAGRLPDGSPDNDHHIQVQMGNFGAAWVPHPDVDLAIIPIGQTLASLQQSGRLPFIVSLEQSLIPTDEELKALNPVEQVLTVGFPGRLWDDVHNLPVFHRGYTSTAPYIDFKGKKEFLIDIATWPGASGSPVLLYNDNPWMNRHGGTVVGGIRAKLLGVVYGVAVQDVTGNIVLQNAPTQIIASTAMQVPTNLGGCIRASRILEFEPLLVNKGLKPPVGYVMRATYPP